jgi:type IV pilus assembly protein PilA
MAIERSKRVLANEVVKGRVIYMKNEQGFTLIELLVVVAIIGILAAIAIPQYSSYKDNAYNAAAASDLRNIAAAEEAYFAENNAYLAVDCQNVAANAACSTSLPGMASGSRGVSLTVTVNGSTFTGTATHASGSKTCSWDSAAGGLTGCS